MAKTEMKTIAAMSDTEVEAFIIEKRTFIQSSRFGTGARDTKAIRTAKRDIARAMTHLNQNNVESAPSTTK